MSFFQELLNSLQGTAGTDIGAARSAAIQGGQQVLGTTPAPAAPPAANIIDLNALVDAAAPSAPPAAGGPDIGWPLPIPVGDYSGPSAGKEQLFASILSAIEQEDQGSRAAQLIPPVAEIKPGGSDIPATVEEAAAVPTPGQKAAGAGGRGKGKAAGAADTELEALLKAASRTSDRSGERGGLDKQRMDLLARAESEKELSNEEKVAVALLGALPGLVGAIGGGAIAGGYGAAAGAAGGLQGGAAGIQGISEAKAGRRKEAKTEAQVLAERIAKLDDMMSAEKNRSADKQLEIMLGERSAKRQEAMQAKQLAQQWAMNERNQGVGMQKALLEAQTKFVTSQKENRKKLTDVDVAFGGNVEAGIRAAQEIQRLVKAGGANIGAHLRNDGVAHLLDQQISMLAQSYSKVVDPGSAVLLGELQNTRKTILSEPTTTRTNIFLGKALGAAKEIAERAHTNSRITGFEYPAADEFLRGQTSEGPHGKYVRQDTTGQIYVWDGTKYTEAN